MNSSSYRAFGLRKSSCCGAGGIVARLLRGAIAGEIRFDGRSLRAGISGAEPQYRTGFPRTAAGTTCGTEIAFGLKPGPCAPEMRARSGGALLFDLTLRSSSTFTLSGDETKVVLASILAMYPWSCPDEPTPSWIIAAQAAPLYPATEPGMGFDDHHGGTENVAVSTWPTGSC